MKFKLYAGFTASDSNPEYLGTFEFKDHAEANAAIQKAARDIYAEHIGASGSPFYMSWMDCLYVIRGRARGEEFPLKSVDMLYNSLVDDAMDYFVEEVTDNDEDTEAID